MNSEFRTKIRTISHCFLRLITNILYFFPKNDRKIPIFAYHRVCPLYHKKEIQYFNVYPEEFDKQMGHLKDHFEVITVSSYLQKLKTSNISGNEVCITFDDGFKDNYIYAYPILKKHGLKASFFLTTKYIGGNTIFPWVQLDNGAKEDIKIHRERWLPLSWEEVREMIEYGMEFGTHTHTHKGSLSGMDIKDAEGEIAESSEMLKEKTGIYPEIFSYPHGTFKDYNTNHVELLKKYKYKIALTTNTGRNSRMQNPYELKRIIVYEEDSLWEFKKKVNGAHDIAEDLQKLWLNVAGSKPCSGQ